MRIPIKQQSYNEFQRMSVQKSKKAIGFLYVAILVVMATATIIEKSQGTDYVHTHYYGAWWFILLWAIMTALGIFYIVRRRVKTPSTLALHLAFVIILAGALLTHVTAKRGMIHLRVGQPNATYMTNDNQQGIDKETLPFSLTLNRFETKFHEGTRAESDYLSLFTVTDGKEKIAGSVSMNNIFSYRQFRFYQASYDEDGQGSILTINADPYGIPVTYTGYVLLFISLIWILIDPKGGYRRAIHSPLLKKGILAAILLTTTYNSTNAQNVLPRETADRFGRLYILYNDRICPVQTYAIDFCKKIYGDRSYKSFTPEQVLSGWIFYSDDWAKEPFIKVKGGVLKETLMLPDFCSLNSFFNHDMGGYTIGQYVQDFYQGNHDKFHQQAADIDDKIQLIMDLRRGMSLKVLPYTYPHTISQGKGLPLLKKGETTWFSPTDKLPAAIEKQHALYISNVFSLLYEDVRAGRFDRANIYFDKMLQYQRISAGKSLPSVTQYKAEHINNAVPFATILFMINLTLGFLGLFYTIYCLVHDRRIRIVDYALPILLLLSFATLTFALALRWTISGNIPMSNGYETMLSMAWCTMLITLCLQHRIRILTTFGFILSGFFLLVSHINQMDPAIGQMMPVLNSPLLSMHVSVIMISYAMLSITFLCGIMGIFLRSHGDELQALSRLFLYPAMTTLGFGIFIGAIWANVSWGSYWSWDSKETWALITFMVYAVVLHTHSIPALRKPLVYHIYLTLAFLSILMTYFGVNYFLAGMHSYA